MTAFQGTGTDLQSAVLALLVLVIVGIAVAAWVGRNEVQP